MATLSSLAKLRRAAKPEPESTPPSLPEPAMPADVAVIQASLASTLTALERLRQDSTQGKTKAAEPAASESHQSETASSQEEPAADETADEWIEILDQPIGTLTTNIRCTEGDLPADLSAREFGGRPALPSAALAARHWPGVLYEWEAPGLCHRPLYFEEENLERYGYTHRRNWIFQPAISGGRFVATIVALPYLTTLRPPCECVYTLGYYRPGSCVPFQARLLELNAKAAAVEAAAVTGLIFAIP